MQAFAVYNRSIGGIASFMEGACQKESSQRQE